MNEHDCWNPGVESSIPKQYQGYETVYDTKNTITNKCLLLEYEKITGINPLYLVLFNAKRVVLHEVLIRVTADIVVSEGEGETGFDKEYREVVNEICKEYIFKNWAEINSQYLAIVSSVQRRVKSKIQETLFNTKPEELIEDGVKGWLKRRLGKPFIKPKSVQPFCEYEIIRGYKNQGLNSICILERAVYKSLYLVIGAIKNHRGFIGRDVEMLAGLVANHVLANYGSQEMGKIIAPYIEQAKIEKGYSLVKHHKSPVLISLKGPSAAGKSYLRTMLRDKITDFGIEPDSNATISPDVWRRLLLNFESLGEAYKYAGALTGAEVALVDRKLDQYIREKSEQVQAIPHILVDRFRFDSFSSVNVARVLHATYAKYITTMHMYFMVTPPEKIVERGWLRGLSQGRYKSVEDLLAHSVEAYQGMPKLFFKWMAYDRPVFKFYFMDNSVVKGEYPRVIAYGSQNIMHIIDVSRFLDIEKFKKINIKAKSADELYADTSLHDAKENTGFFKQCVHGVKTVMMVDQQSQKVYAKFYRGRLQVLDKGIYALKIKDDTYRALFI